MKDKNSKPKKTFIFKKKSFWIVSLIVIVSAAFFFYRSNINKNSGNESMQIKKGTVEEVLTLSGEIKADEYAKLTFPTSGEISWVGVKEGDLVKKGQAITKLNTVVLNSTFQSARATLRAAEATVQNVHDQVKDHDGDETYAQKDARTTAEATKDRAYEAYVAAEYNLRNSTITSPFSGILTSLTHPFPGVNVMVTETQAEVLNPDTMYFEVSADQSEVLKLSLGQNVDIVLDSVSEDVLEGKISFIGFTPRSDEVGTIYKVKIIFDDKIDSKKYRVGLTGDANFVISHKENVFYVEPKYIKSDVDGRYLRKSAKNRKTYVEIGIEGEDRTEIISDEINEGDVIYD